MTLFKPVDNVIKYILTFTEQVNAKRTYTQIKCYAVASNWRFISGQPVQKYFLQANEKFRSPSLGILLTD